MSKAISPREEVVRQLKEVRKAEGITQEHLAELVGTKKSNISRLESGRYNPSLARMYRCGYRTTNKQSKDYKRLEKQPA